MAVAIVLSLAASFCTATSSVCQRLGARGLEGRSGTVTGFDGWLVFRLARQPAWLLGFACMIGGFAFQVAALHFGPLALVQPLLAVELVIVFGYMAAALHRRVEARDWLAAAAISAGISVFLRAAAPSGGRAHAAAGAWWLAGLVTLAIVILAVAAAGFAPVGGHRGARMRAGVSPSRRAAFLGVATGVGWGFTAAVIKELASRLDGGPGAVFTNWSAYVLMGTGAATLLLTSHAMAAGPLAASQPGFTICDPVAAVLLGFSLFGERLQSAPWALAAQVIALLVLAAGVWALSRSRLITSGARVVPGPPADGRAHGEFTRKSG